MQKFDAIRPFFETEVNEALQSVISHPMMKALMGFTFPDVDEEVWKDQLKRTFKFSTFYGAYNGNNSISDVTTYSVREGLSTTTTTTPYDYSAVFGLRKIQRFGYEGISGTSHP